MSLDLLLLLLVLWFFWLPVFLVFKSTCGCVPINLEFRVSFSLASECVILTPALFRCDDVRLLLGFLVCGLWTFLTNTVDCA